MDFYGGRAYESRAYVHVSADVAAVDAALRAVPRRQCDSQRPLCVQEAHARPDSIR